YQIVNDRGLDPNPGGVAFAATNDLATSEIASFSLRLVVDPRYITSWGHFKDAGFTVVAPDRSIKGDVRASADGVEAKIRMAVSSNPPSSPSCQASVFYATARPTPWVSWATRWGWDCPTSVSRIHS